PHKITLNPVNVFSPMSASDYPDNTKIKGALGIVAAANPPVTWTQTQVTNSAPQGIGLSVSEPLPQNSYYPPPTDKNVLNTDLINSGLFDAYGDLNNGAGVGKFLDTPLDGQLPRPLAEFTNGNRTQTTPNYRTVFLQRLANPLAPYHPLTNPYLTI